MKIFSVFSLIALVHIAIIGTLLVQPGCQTNKAEAPEPTVTRVDREQSSSERFDSPSTPRTKMDSSFNSGLQTSTESDRNLSEPMRPVVNTNLTRKIDDSVLEPVFNPTQENGRTGGSSTYTVQRGDTLSKIARSENVSLVDLMAANSLSKSSTIFVGQALVIPVSNIERVSVASSSNAISEGGTTHYTVRSGDNLSTIAKRNGVTVAMIKSVNGLRNDTIFVGQELKLPIIAGLSSTSVPTAYTTPTLNPTASGTNYTVKPGDTPSGIAKKFGVTSQALMSVNGITDPRKLFVGQELVIPSGGTKTNVSESTIPKATSAQPKPVVISSPSTKPKPSQDDPMAVLEALEDDDLPFSDVEEINDKPIEPKK